MVKLMFLKSAYVEKTKKIKIRAKSVYQKVSQKLHVQIQPAGLALNQPYIYNIRLCMILADVLIALFLTVLRANL
jgi:hypothetical protein